MTTPDQASIDTAKATHRKELDTWLFRFKAAKDTRPGISIQYVDDAADLLNEWYWKRLENDVLPYLEPENGDILIPNRYKVASCTELCVMDLLPIQGADISTRLTLNAELAHNMALNIMLSWDLDDASALNLPNAPNAIYFQDAYKDQRADILERREIQEFIREHITFLAKSEPQFSFPVFSNADTLKLFHWYFLTLLSFQDVILRTDVLREAEQYPTQLPPLSINHLF
jgi:hypothetical protein